MWPAFLNNSNVQDNDDPRVHVRRIPRARRLTLRVDSLNDRIICTVPKHINNTKLSAFLRDHEAWIERHLKALPDRIPLTDGTILPIFGQNHRIEIRPRDGRSRVTIGNGTVCLETNDFENAAVRLRRHLKAQAKDRLEALSREKAACIGKTVNRVTVRDTTSRWGSCSIDGNLNYSWRLIFAPPEALDYVVAHEVAHLKHMDHSRAFWATCRQLSEDYLSGRQWMHEHGNGLMRYG